MNKENCALKLVNEIILYYDARSKKHQNNLIIIRREIVFFERKNEITSCFKTRYPFVIYVSKEVYNHLNVT